MFKKKVRSRFVDESEVISELDLMDINIETDDLQPLRCGSNGYIEDIDNEPDSTTSGENMNATGIVELQTGNKLKMESKVSHEAAEVKFRMKIRRTVLNSTLTLTTRPATYKTTEPKKRRRIYTKEEYF